MVAVIWRLLGNFELLQENYSDMEKVLIHRH